MERLGEEVDIQILVAKSRPAFFLEEGWMS